MENQELSKLVDEKLRYLYRINFYSISLLLLATIMCYILHLYEKNYSFGIPNHYLRYTYFFIAIPIIFINHYVRKVRLFLKKPTEKRLRVAHYMQSVMITLLSFNAIWIFGLILSIAGDKLLYLYLFVCVAIIMIIIYRPKHNELMKLIEEDK